MKITLCVVFGFLVLRLVECQFQGRGLYKKCVKFDRNARNKEVRGTLSVDVSVIRIEWMTQKRRVYNGKLCGPTIRVKAGDKLVITLINRLGPNHEEGVHNEFRLPNTTNLHLHGLHIGSDAPGDDVFIRVDPGEQYIYKYEINKAQPAGTYWYHAHWHGSTYFQVMSGMSGMLIVEDEVASMSPQLAAVSCPDNCYRDIELLLQSTLQYAGDDNSPDFSKTRREIKDDKSLDPEDIVQRRLSNSVDHFTVNGMILPVLNMDIGYMRRFRIVNAGGFSSLELGITAQGSSIPTQYCHVWEIAFDGVYLDKPRRQYNSQTYLAVGARVDWMVYCRRRGNYELRSYNDPSNELSIGGKRRYSGVIMNIRVNTAIHPINPSILSKLPGRPQFIRDLRKNLVDAKFIVEITPDFLLNREGFTNKDDPRYKMKAGSVQEWQFINTIPDSSHPIHIHVNHFQIISYNSYTGPISKTTKSGNQFILRDQNDQLCKIQHKDYDPNRIEKDTSFIDDLHFLYNASRASEGLGYAKIGDWRDVLNVPPLSNITIRFFTHQYTGTVVIHCHILLHEDKGMMMVAEIVKEDDTSGEARIGSGGDNMCPGFCMTSSSDIFPSGCKEVEVICNNKPWFTELNRNWAIKTKPYTVLLKWEAMQQNFLLGDFGKW